MYSKEEYLKALVWNYNISMESAMYIYIAHKKDNNLRELDACVEGYYRNKDR